MSGMSSWAGNLIKLARLESGLSQRELARRARTSQATISAYENGEKSPSVDTLKRIIGATGLELRIQLAPADNHDEWLTRYEQSLPPEVVERSQRRDRELIKKARTERQKLTTSR
jgi:transcriptional regulator with XRE-family HTH domain